MSKNVSPLVAKAFNDLAQVMGPHVVTELTTGFMQTAFSFIDTDIDRPQEEKEALKTSLVLYFGASYMEPNQKNLATEYTPLVAEMVEAALQQPYTDTMAEVQDKNVAQMGLALRCATMQEGADEIRLDLEQNPAEAQQMREDILSMKSNPAVTAAPRLLARLEQMTEDLIKNIPAAQNSPRIEFGKIGIPRTPKGPSEIPPVSVPREPKGPSKPLRGPGIPRPPK